MSADEQKDIYSYVAAFPGLVLEIFSDNWNLLKIDIIKGKKPLSNKKNFIPDPIIKTISFFDDYFTGKRSSLKIVFDIKSSSSNSERDTDTVLHLDMSSYTVNEIRIYKKLLEIRPGKTISYGDLAEYSGIARGARFTGNCMAKNNFPLIIPCHRVIKKDGSIGNYGGGVEIKKFLLKHETDMFFYSNSR